MPPNPGITALTTALTEGLAAVVAAIEANGAAVDLAPLTAMVERVAEAAETANTQAASVIGDFGGQARILTNEGP